MLGEPSFNLHLYLENKLKWTQMVYLPFYESIEPDIAFCRFVPWFDKGRFESCKHGIKEYECNADMIAIPQRNRPIIEIKQLIGGLRLWSFKQSLAVLFVCLFVHSSITNGSRAH